jgi:hypothetical protein
MQLGAPIEPMGNTSVDIVPNRVHDVVAVFLILRYTIKGCLYAGARFII